MRASGVGKEVTHVGLSRVYYFGRCYLVAAFCPLSFSEWLTPYFPPRTYKFLLPFIHGEWEWESGLAELTSH
jgi:hypothetical protein